MANRWERKDPNGRAYYLSKNITVNGKKSIPSGDKNGQLDSSDFSQFDIFIRDFSYGMMTDEELDYLNGLIVEFKDISTPSWRRHQIWRALNWAPTKEQLYSVKYRHFYDLNGGHAYAPDSTDRFSKDVVDFYYGGQSGKGVTWLGDGGGTRELENVFSFHLTHLLGFTINPNEDRKDGFPGEQGTTPSESEMSPYFAQSDIRDWSGRYIKSADFKNVVQDPVWKYPPQNDDEFKKNPHPNINLWDWKLKNKFLGLYAITPESKFTTQYKDTFVRPHKIFNDYICIDDRTTIIDMPLNNSVNDVKNDGLIGVYDSKDFDGVHYANRTPIPFFTLPWVSSQDYLKPFNLRSISNAYNARGIDQESDAHVVNHNGSDHWKMYTLDGDVRYIPKPFKLNSNGEIGEIGNLDPLIRAKKYGHCLIHWIKQPKKIVQGDGSGRYESFLYKYSAQITDQEIVFLIRLKYGFAHAQSEPEWGDERIKAKRTKDDPKNANLVDDVQIKRKHPIVTYYTIPFWNDEADKPGNLGKFAYGDVKIGKTYDCKDTMLITKEATIKKQAETCIDISTPLTSRGGRDPRNTDGQLSLNQKIHVGIVSSKIDELDSSLSTVGRVGWFVSYWPDLWMTQESLKTIASKSTSPQNINQIFRFSDLRSYWRASKILKEVVSFANYIVSGLDTKKVLAVMGEVVNIDPCKPENEPGGLGEMQVESKNKNNPSLFFISAHSTEDEKSEYDKRPWLPLFHYSSIPNAEETYKSDREVHSSFECGTTKQYLRNLIRPNIDDYNSEIFYDSTDIQLTASAITNRAAFYNPFDWDSSGNFSSRMDNRGLYKDLINSISTVKKWDATAAHNIATNIYFNKSVKNWASFKDGVFLPTLITITIFEVCGIFMHHKPGLRGDFSKICHVLVYIIESALVGTKVAVNYRKEYYTEAIRDFAVGVFIGLLGQQLAKKVLGSIIPVTKSAQALIAVVQSLISFGIYVYDKVHYMEEYGEKANEFLKLLNEATKQGFVEGPYAQTGGAVRIKKGGGGQLPIKTSVDKDGNVINEYENFETKKQEPQKEDYLEMNRRFLEPNGEGERTFFTQLTEFECKVLLTATDFSNVTGNQNNLNTFPTIADEEEYMKSITDFATNRGITSLNDSTPDFSNPKRNENTQPEYYYKIPFVDVAPNIYDLGHFKPADTSVPLKDRLSQVQTFDSNNMIPDADLNKYLPRYRIVDDSGKTVFERFPDIHGDRYFWYETLPKVGLDYDRQPYRGRVVKSEESSLLDFTGPYALAGPGFIYTRSDIGSTTNLEEFFNIEGGPQVYSVPTHHFMEIAHGIWNDYGIYQTKKSTEYVQVRLNNFFTTEYYPDTNSRMDFREAIWMIRKKYGLSDVRRNKYCCGIYDIPAPENFALDEYNQSKENPNYRISGCTYMISFGTPSFREKLKKHCNCKEDKKKEEQRSENSKDTNSPANNWNEHHESKFQTAIIENWLKDQDNLKHLRRSKKFQRIIDGKVEQATGLSDSIYGLSQLPRLGIPPSLPGNPISGKPLTTLTNVTSTYFEELKNHKADVFLKSLNFMGSIYKTLRPMYFHKVENASTPLEDGGSRWVWDNDLMTRQRLILRGKITNRTRRR